MLAHGLDVGQRLAVQAAGVERKDAEAVRADGAVGHVDQGDILRAAERDAEAGEAVERLGDDVGWMGAFEAGGSLGCVVGGGGGGGGGGVCHLSLTDRRLAGRNGTISVRIVIIVAARRGRRV